MTVKSIYYAIIGGYDPWEVTYMDSTNNATDVLVRIYAIKINFIRHGQMPLGVQWSSVRAGCCHAIRFCSNSVNESASTSLSISQNTHTPVIH